LTQTSNSFDESSAGPGGDNSIYPAGKGLSDKSPRKSRLSYLTLFFLLIFWPMMSVAFVGDPTEALRILSVSPIFFIYLPTIAIQWLVFLLVWVTVYREGTGLAGVGFKRIRLIDFAWAGAFLITSNLILTLLSVLLAAVNLEVPVELELMLPKTGTEKIMWFFLSLTAGVCEEAAFRGYLITRLRIFGQTKNWVTPVILASLAFGSGHAYQGIGGFILISIYGAMFALLFIRTKTLWPLVIAHFVQDFVAVFYKPSS